MKSCVIGRACTREREHLRRSCIVSNVMPLSIMQLWGVTHRLLLLQLLLKSIRFAITCNHRGVRLGARARVKHWSERGEHGPRVLKMSCRKHAIL